MAEPKLAKGDKVVLQRLGRTTRGEVVEATEQLIIIRAFGSGIIVHVKFDAALNDWTCGGTRASVTRQ